jgi:antitoxin component YwqK of YwqJK toxin-antitoxin module
MNRLFLVFILALPFICSGQISEGHDYFPVDFKDVLETDGLIYFKADTTLVTGRVIRYNKKHKEKKYIIVTKGKPDNLGWISIKDKYTPPEKSNLGSLVTGAAQVIDFIDPIDIPTSRTTHASDASIDSYLDYNKEFIKKEYKDTSDRNKISKNLQSENEVIMTPFEENNKKGQIEDKGNYIDGKKDGLWEEYYDNGRLKAKGVYKEGKEDGTWEVFNEQGKLKAKINYRLGIKMKTEKFE